MSEDFRRLTHRLGYAGLVPFVLGCALIWLIGDRNLDQHAFVSLALSAWAGLIVAFLGGIHWGLSFARGLPGRQPLVWGISAVLLGWLGVLMSPYAGLALHGGVLIACYAVDRRVYPQLGAGDWLTLRFRLTAVASLSCFLAAAGS
ncbi:MULTISPECIES: DUF3429 domain-containing protein [Roseateles]|uniref:DUF3429 domain-containing protein n=1 Tax=Pelomonas caseinilytica TaxID=2906763 RepID=A0ABS8XLL8_9BURK|nr:MULTISPECIES: DUF3429 domain-containing protein [unclassified Roseateles]MCE4538125.1 DUF3429 domain-containing protein [Pelomonas sp. P7]HEV6965245.1 DUF3429 domain-containing protein [Roseateles sp.]